jgi:hypothetical protein
MGCAINRIAESIAIRRNRSRRRIKQLLLIGPLRHSIGGLLALFDFVAVAIFEIGGDLYINLGKAGAVRNSQLLASLIELAPCQKRTAWRSLWYCGHYTGWRFGAPRRAWRRKMGEMRWPA